MLLSSSDTYFLKVSAYVFLKVATKGNLEVKKVWNFDFNLMFSKTKTEECDQKTWNFSAKSEMFCLILMHTF